MWRKDEGLPRYDVLQPEYNLYDRFSFEGALRDLCMAEDIGVITYFSLAKGFLSGKYRSAADLGQSPRGGGVEATISNARGMRILAALDAVSARHGAKPAEVALAWIMARHGVTAPIASATSIEQLDSLIKASADRAGRAISAELDRRASKRTERRIGGQHGIGTPSSRSRLTAVGGRAAGWAPAPPRSGTGRRPLPSRRSAAA